MEVTLPLLVELDEQLSKARFVAQRGDVRIADQPAVVSVNRTLTDQVDGQILFADEGGQFDRVVVGTTGGCIEVLQDLASFFKLASSSRNRCQEHRGYAR